MKHGIFSVHAQELQFVEAVIHNVLYGPHRYLKRKADFIEPMLLERSPELPDGPEWLHELKIDGYRAIRNWDILSVTLPAQNVSHS